MADLWGNVTRRGSGSGNVRGSALAIRDLHVYYGQSHALQGVNLTLDSGVHAVVGRNGMGKTTLCKTIMGLEKARSGSISVGGEEMLGLPPYKIAARGIAYTPQGRRLWPSLSVDEHLKLCDTGKGAWNTERIYATFPRLAERRRNGGAQLSGGEQQMLAIGRALLRNPRLLIMDEPTEGLAPVIVEHVERLLASLAEEGDVAILLIEQNIAVATSVAKDVAIMVNGRISRVLPAAQLAGDRALQERLLGVGRHSHEDVAEIEIPAWSLETSRTPAPEAPSSPQEPSSREPVEDVQRPRLDYVPPTRWSAARWKADATQPVADKARPFDRPVEPLFTAPMPALGEVLGNEVIVAGTFDTKGVELNFIRDRISAQGIRVRSVDLSTSGKPSAADIPPHAIAAYHPKGASGVFTGDRGQSVRAMAVAFEAWMRRQRGIGGVISAAGSGGTALATPAMRALPIGLPKVMISTVASGDVGGYVGASDIMMMYSVTDVQGLNRISRRVLANGADALAGMVRAAQREAQMHRRASTTQEADKPGLGLTMFGVTTTAVQQISAGLKDRYDCLVFHATGVGGRSMEKLVDSGLMQAAIDLTTTEVCDMMMGGVFPADEDRFGAFIRTRIPYVVSLGALDMVNFGPRDTVSDKYRGRLFVEHNPLVTLMRTTAEENTHMGEWIAGRLNQMTGPVRLLIPEGGVSALDAPGQPFHDPAADKALFDAIARNFREAGNRRMVRLPHHINDPEFARACVAALAEIHPLTASVSATRSDRHAAL